MPFMKGAAPIRRTLKYLESGKVVFRDNVKVFTIAFKREGENHQGARDLIFWNLPQIQYKNPKVQCLMFPNLTPTPFIKIYLQNAKCVLIDIDGRDKEEIIDHLVNFTAICKTQKELNLDERVLKRKGNFSYFGYGCERHCICEVLGQVPCSSIVLLPKSWRKGGLSETNIKRLNLPPCYMERGLEDLVDEDD